MNAKQSLKAAAKHIENMEHSIRLYVLDVKAYNRVIDCLIAGGSACRFCEDEEECSREGKGTIPGCDEWILRSNLPEDVEKVEVELKQEPVLEIEHAGGPDE